VELSIEDNANSPGNVLALRSLLYTVSVIQLLTAQKKLRANKSCSIPAQLKTSAQLSQ
jgi:hypothetical protein